MAKAKTYLRSCMESAETFSLLERFSRVSSSDSDQWVPAPATSTRLWQSLTECPGERSPEENSYTLWQVKREDCEDVETTVHYTKYRIKLGTKDSVADDVMSLWKRQHQLHLEPPCTTAIIHIGRSANNILQVCKQGMFSKPARSCYSLLVCTK